MNSEHLFEQKALSCSSVLSNFYLTWNTLLQKYWGVARGLFLNHAARWVSWCSSQCVSTNSWDGTIEWVGCCGSGAKMNSGRQWKQLTSGVLPANFVSSWNHDLKVVRFSTVQSYSVHKKRCFPSSFARMTSSAGLWTGTGSAWGYWRSWLLACWHNNFLERLEQVGLVFLHHFSDLWTILSSHLSSKQGGFRHSMLIGWADGKRQMWHLWWQLWIIVRRRSFGGGWSRERNSPESAKMVMRDICLRFPV